MKKYSVKYLIVLLLSNMMLTGCTSAENTIECTKTGGNPPTYRLSADLKDAKTLKLRMYVYDGEWTLDSETVSTVSSEEVDITVILNDHHISADIASGEEIQSVVCEDAYEPTWDYTYLNHKIELSKGVEYTVFIAADAEDKSKIAWCEDDSPDYLLIEGMERASAITIILE